MKGDAELLAAYVDGVTELSTDERRRVEALLAREPALRGDEAATRALLGELRDLPPVGSAPDWAALARAIGDAIDADRSARDRHPWYARLRWRWLVPTLALATAAALVALVVQPPAPAPTGAPTGAPSGAPTGAPIAHAPSVPTPAPPRAATVPLWLDGVAVEVEADASHELLEGWPPEAGDDDGAPGLLPAADLAWIDALDDDALEVAEQWLADRARPGGPS